MALLNVVVVHAVRWAVAVVVVAMAFASQTSAQIGVVASGSGCTTTVSDLASVVSQSASQPSGATICIADGSYGTLNLTAGRKDYVTIKAANGPGHVTLSGLTIPSGASFLHLDGLTVSNNTQLGFPASGGTGPNHIQIANTDSKGFQVKAGSHDLLFDHDYSHDGPYGFLLNGSRYPVPGGCCQTSNLPFITNVTISNSKIARPQADAFQLKGFQNVTISNNEITMVTQNGNHNDGVQTVHGGSNLTITHNYFHDGNVELFMIKDGLVNGLNVTDNLVVRENSSLNPPCNCSTAVFGQILAPTNAVIRNNTILQPMLALRSRIGLVGGGNPDYPEPSNVKLDHNMITQFRAQDDDRGGALGAFATAMTESNDIFGTWTKNYLTSPFPGPGTVFDNSPAYMCGSSCGNRTVAGDDYRLAFNPSKIGIDWAPSQYRYGPH
jgi:hypothetical protein